MDKFVEQVVARVLGGPKASPQGMPTSEGVARPNYQRQKTQRRLIVSDVSSTPPATVSAPPPSGADPMAAVRRTSLAASMPCASPTACNASSCACRKKSAQTGTCRCSSSHHTVVSRRMDAPPRSLAGVLGLRCREGDSIVSASMPRADSARLIATDAVLVHYGIAPEAMAYTDTDSTQVLLTFGARAEAMDPLMTALEARWQACSDDGGGVCSPMPSSRLLSYLGITRRGAIGVACAPSAAEAVLILSHYLKGADVSDIRLVGHAALLFGSADEIQAGLARWQSLLATVER